MKLSLIHISYLSEEERVEAVRGIDFSAEEGKVTGIVGESGSGKSTAMQMCIRDRLYASFALFGRTGGVKSIG